MNEQLQKEIFSRLDALAAKLGVAAEHLWAVLVRQQYINGAIAAFGAALLLAAFVASVVLLYSYGSHRDDHQDEPGWRLWLGVPGSAFAGFLMMAAAQQALTCFLNPEFAALKQLMEILK